jgi:hypothetical protein
MARGEEGGGVKKWFMLQMWRLQQIAQLATLALLAVNLSLMVYDYMSWRGSLFGTPYTGVPLIALVLVGIIWIFSIIWDLRMRMWREQHSVLVEKNPYTKEKMTAKEIAIYAYVWLPLMDRIGKDDPSVREAAETIRKWLLKAYVDDKSLAREVKEITDFIGNDAASVEAYLKK